MNLITEMIGYDILKHPSVSCVFITFFFWIFFPTLFSCCLLGTLNVMWNSRMVAWIETERWKWVNFDMIIILINADIRAECHQLLCGPDSQLLSISFHLFECALFSFHSSVSLRSRFRFVCVLSVVFGRLFEIVSAGWRKSMIKPIVALNVLFFIWSVKSFDVRTSYACIRRATLMVSGGPCCILIVSITEIFRLVTRIGGKKPYRPRHRNNTHSHELIWNVIQHMN